MVKKQSQILTNIYIKNITKWTIKKIPILCNINGFILSALNLSGNYYDKNPSL